MKTHLLAATSVVAAVISLAVPFNVATAKPEYIFRPIPPKPSDFVKPTDPASPTTPATPSGPVLSYNGTSATVGYPMTATPTFSATPGSSLKFTLVKGTLPSTLSLDPDTGAITGQPAAPTELALTIQAEDLATKAKSLAPVTLLLRPVETVADAIPRVTQGGADVTGAAYDVLTSTLTNPSGETLLTFDRHRSANTFEITGPGASLPWSLEAETSSGWATILNGSSPGSHVIQGGVTAKAFRLSAGGALASLRITWSGTAPHAPSIQGTSRISLVEGEPLYRALIAIDTAGQPAWSVSSGTLPTGITLGTDGALSGSTQQVGVHRAGVVVADPRATSAPAEVTVAVQSATTADGILPASASRGSVAALYDASGLTDVTVPAGETLLLTYARTVRANSVLMSAGPGQTQLELDYLDPSSATWKTAAAASTSGFNQFEDTSASEWRLRVTSGSATLKSFRIGYMGVAPTAPAVNVPSASASLTEGAYATAFALTVSDGGPTPTFAVTSGTLPPGMNPPDEYGRIAGTPTQAGTYGFTVTATNKATGVVSVPLALTVTVTGRPASLVARADKVVILKDLDLGTTAHADTALDALYDQADDRSLVYYQKTGDLLRMEWNSPQTEMDCAIANISAGAGNFQIQAGSYTSQYNLQPGSNETIPFDRKTNATSLTLRVSLGGSNYARVYTFRPGNLVNGECVAP
jgi:hypothetical protein